jgi:hypothetical protein
MTLFFLILSYFKGMFFYVLGETNRASLSYQKLLDSSFNLPEKFRYSYKSVLSELRKVVKIPVKLYCHEQTESINDSSIVYDLSDVSKEERIHYLRFYGIENELVFVTSQELIYFSSFSHKVWFLFVTIPIQIQLLILGLFKKDISGLSFVLKNILITSNFLILSLRQKIKDVYMFGIYDTNSAFLSYSLMKNNRFVHQITSEVPIYKWNKIIVTNELILCSEYQFAEVEAFKKTVVYDSCKLFGPELYYKVAHMYQLPAVRNNKVAFYSTGGWVRNKLGNIDQGIDIECFEEKILKDIDDCLSKYNELELIIYPHPREKVYFDHSIKLLQQHYLKFLPNCKFTIKTENILTNEFFNECYLAICFISTVIFERVHAKRQSVLMYQNEKEFPLKNNVDYLHFINNKDELKTIIKKCYFKIA